MNVQPADKGMTKRDEMVNGHRDPSGSLETFRELV